MCCPQLLTLIQSGTSRYHPTHHLRRIFPFSGLRVCLLRHPLVAGEQPFRGPICFWNRFTFRISLTTAELAIEIASSTSPPLVTAPLGFDDSGRQPQSPTLVQMPVPSVPAASRTTPSEHKPPAQSKHSVYSRYVAYLCKNAFLETYLFWQRSLSVVNRSRQGGRTDLATKIKIFTI